MFTTDLRLSQLRPAEMRYALATIHNILAQVGHGELSHSDGIYAIGDALNSIGCAPMDEDLRQP